MKKMLLVLGLNACSLGVLSAQITGSPLHVENLYFLVYQSPSFGITGSEYVAEVKATFSSTVGEVKTLLQRTSFDKIPAGRYRVSLSRLFDDFYRIEGTDFVVDVSYGFVSALAKYILESTGYSLQLTEEEA